MPYLQATGMKGKEYFRLGAGELTELHTDSELFMLPDRDPVGFDPDSGRYVEFTSDPLRGKKETCYPVAAFLSPGYTASFSASYRERGKAGMLPLFSYSAVAFYKGKFYAAGIRVDREKRQELKGMDIGLLRENMKEFRRIFPKNRLVRHLERCALVYGCPAAKNFFLKRYECPLPTSPTCNARCIGCISYQPGKGCSVTQPRITFVPSPEEVAEIALFHIRHVKDPVVSFGQGCEGEPLMVGDVLERSVKLIRKATARGIINLNTNASKPDVIRRLFDAGMDSMRVSVSSFDAKYYSRYYLPRGYSMKDVKSSIRYAKRKGGFISINYLVMPGFTDSRRECGALFRFLERYGPDMVQWRNLNYDPAAYFRRMKIAVKRQDMIGVDTLIKTVKKEFPGTMHGYFNPSRARMKRGKNMSSRARP